MSTYESCTIWTWGQSSRVARTAVGETSEKGELRRSRRLSVRSAPASHPNWTLPNLHRHAARHSAAYAVARPFPHAVIDNLFPPSSLAALSGEIPEKIPWISGVLAPAGAAIHSAPADDQWRKRWCQKHGPSYGGC